MPRPPENPDVIVLGAGPAGCAAAAVLASQGRSVVILEKTTGPHYVVGESLIPHCWDALDRLGLVDKINASQFSVTKHSVQFASIAGKVSQPYYFFQHTDHPRAKTWQVRREDFDALLKQNAVDKGAQLHEGTTAKELLVDDGRVSGVRAVGPDGEAFDLRAPVTVDATGRATFAQIRFGWRVPDAVLKKIAIWTYYRGSKRGEGLDEGPTTIAYLPDKGWFWHIPLPNDIASVGVVADKDYLYRDTKNAQEIFEREAQVQRWIADRLETGTRIDEFRTTKEFSYRSRHCAVDGLVLAGDAFAFLDPVFSSGVYFALTSGVMVGDAVHAALEAGDTSGRRFAEYGRAFLKQMEPMRLLVYAFYDTGFNFGEFLSKYPHHRDDLTDCLIGDLDRDFDEFFAAVAEFAKLPNPLPYGEPLDGPARV